MVLSGPTMWTTLRSNLRTGHFSYLGLKKGQKRAKIAVVMMMAIWDPIFNGTGLNKVGMALRTSRLSSLDHLLDPEMLPYRGQKGPK